MLNKIKNFNLIDWTKQNKFKLAMTWIVLLTLISFFMLALTFNLVGNDISSTNLILGFTFGILGSLTGTAAGFWLFRNKKFDWIALSLIGALTVFFLLCSIFGGIGYINNAVDLA